MRWTEYELADTGVKVREKDLHGIREITIEYDRIGREATYFLRHSAIAKLGIILFLIFSIVTGTLYFLHGQTEKLAWVFWLGATAFMFVYYENTKREGFRLVSRYGSVVLSGKKKEVEAFIAATTKKKEEFIEKSIEQRLSIMERPEVEKYLFALREGAVLSQEQYDAIRAKTGLEDDYKPRLGFGV
jgi:hypothetical protein